MSIIIKEKASTHLIFELNNGDFEALNDIIEQWNFKDEVSALRFAIATLYITKRGSLYQEKADGTCSVLAPMDDLINGK